MTTSSKTKGPIPVNIIAGPLGAGKTTAINHLLAQRPATEKWAVLVNEYGLVGLDAALLTDAAERNGVAVREVAGGCICCSASFMFDVSLVLLLQRRPDRLLIEPTGLATLSGILDTLGRKGIREAVDVRSIISLLDPARLHKDVQRVEVVDQIDAADIILASRPDLATIDHLEAFDAWTQDLFPPKRFVGRVERGQIPVELLDLVSQRSARSTHDGHHHHHDHAAHHDHGAHTEGGSADAGSTEVLQSDASNPIIRRDHRSSVASTVGWVCWNGLVFDSTRTRQWLDELSTRPGIRRVKAVLRTSEDWLNFNLADGAEEIRPTGYRRDSRLELVGEDDSLQELDKLETELRACLVAERDNVRVAAVDDVRFGA